MFAVLSFFENIKKNRFTIQLHKAKRAGKHFDLRLEHGSIMKSWATRKLDQLIQNPKLKIALFKTEDHPMDWHKWEGTIESGYGEGEVILWDHGVFDTIKWDDDTKIITFYGNKIQGTYAIISTKKQSDRNLMIKTKNK